MRALILVAALLAAPRPARAGGEPVIVVNAKRFEFAPATLHLRVGVPVVLELRALDRKHGFALPELHLDEVVVPGKPTRVRVVFDHAGTFVFHCSVFCGSGHEDMSGQIVVDP